MMLPTALPPGWLAMARWMTRLLSLETSGTFTGAFGCLALTLFQYRD